MFIMFALYFSVSVTDPTSCSPGHADWDLPAVLPGVFAADPLRDLVADLVMLGHLVALPGQLAAVAKVGLVVVLLVVGSGEALLPVLHHVLAVLPVHLLAVGLQHLVALLPVASLLDGVVLHPTPHLLLVLPVATVVVAVAQDGAHGAQDNLNINTRSERLGGAPGYSPERGRQI